ncbi:MAG TPA: adenylyl-sulfate kinase [Mucilaginibacter sp.]|jgi:adenylyl-sulfate kinase|nr:adenylyl-sulfate kinase [Mucilaginibacter sp.]
MITAKTIWFTGLSGSGKSTLANQLKNELQKKNCKVSLFDGDIIRKGLNNDLGFSMKDRFENIRRIAEVNKLFLDTDISVINAFISPTEDIRKMAREIIGPERFFEIYLNTSLEICIQRDPKGLYKKLSEGKIKDFTGFDSVFEPSQSAQLTINTAVTSPGDCIKLIIAGLNSISNE